MKRLIGLLMLGACAQKADVQVASVEPLGPMEQPAGIVGRDGGVSGEFDGRSVWVYGDSVATEAGSYPSPWRNNTMSWTADLDASDGITGFTQPSDESGSAVEFFPRTAEEEEFNSLHVDDGDCEEPCGARYAIWGSGPVQAGGQTFLAYGQVYSEPGDWNFWYTGSSVATWEDFEQGPIRPLVDSDQADPTLLFGVDDGEWSIPFGDDEFLYLMACSGEVTRCRLGRASAGDLLVRDAWQFWDGNEWQAAASEAAGLFDGSPNMTVHWNESVQRWIAVYMDWGTIKLRTAERPEGPWSAAIDVYSPEQENPIHALAHAEFEDGTTEYISYLADQFYLIRVDLDE